jgi:hypothetical protein
MKIIRFIRGLLIIKPNRKLLWTPNDFKLAKNWAKTQPHPTRRFKTLWDSIYSSKKDSVHILHEVNKKLGY